jgi:hypothetical protein
MGTWLVTFRGALTNEASVALESIGATHTGSHGGGYTAPGGELPPMDTHTAMLDADSSDEAERTLREALEPLGGFGEFKAHPMRN